MFSIATRIYCLVLRKGEGRRGNEGKGVFVMYVIVLAVQCRVSREIC